MAIIQSVGHLILGHQGNSAAPTERAFNQLAEGPAHMGEAVRGGTRMQQNIMLVSDSYAPLIGGATQAMQHLAEQLHSRGHRVTVVTAWQRDAPALEDDGGVAVYRVRDLLSRMRWLSSNPYRHTPPPFPDPEATWRIRSIITRLQPDVVYSYGWISYSCAAAMLGLDIPLILSARDYGYVCALRTMVRYGAVCDGPGVTKCLRCASASYGAPKGIVATAGVMGGSRLLRSKISALQSCSGYVDNVMKRHLLKETGQPLGRMLIDEVIPDFHESFEGQEPDVDILAQLPSDPFILFVGALRRVKGLPELFEAYQRMAGRPPLVIMGTRASETLQIPDGLQVFYDVPHATVMAAWERALFGVAPSILPEALGNVVHEAMSKGCPVIGTIPGGMNDMIEHGVSGMLVPAGDVDALAAAMQCLAQDEPLRRRLSAEARVSAERFTAAEVMPRYVRLFAQSSQAGSIGHALPISPS